VLEQDLKPGNVLVDRYYGQLKLIDFGLSRRQSALQSRVRGMAGTFRYAAV
jgi:serine/threonine protein kinase